MAGEAATGAARAFARALPILLLLAAPAASPPAASAAPGTVEVLLRATAEVAADVLRVADLAAVAGDPAVGRVVVAFAPPAGSSRAVNRQSVAAALAGRFPNPILVGGSRACTAARAPGGPPVITFDRLLALARDALVSRRADLAAAELSLELLLDPALLPAGEAETVEVTLGAFSADRVSGRITVVYGPGFRRVVPFELRGTASRRVARAARTLERGDRVAPGDISWVVERAGIGVRLPALAGDPAGLSARVRTPEGTPLSDDRFERTRCVKKGDKVTLRSDNELIRVEMPALALSDGDVGDVVEARNLKSGRVVKAVVRGPGELATMGAR